MSRSSSREDLQRIDEAVDPRVQVEKSFNNYHFKFVVITYHR